MGYTLRQAHQLWLTNSQFLWYLCSEMKFTYISSFWVLAVWWEPWALLPTIPIPIGRTTDNKAEGQFPCYFTWYPWPTWHGCQTPSSTPTGTPCSHKMGSPSLGIKAPHVNRAPGIPKKPQEARYYPQWRLTNAHWYLLVTLLSLPLTKLEEDIYFFNHKRRHCSILCLVHFHSPRRFGWVDEGEGREPGYSRGSKSYTEADSIRHKNQHQTTPLKNPVSILEIMYILKNKVKW